MIENSARVEFLKKSHLFLGLPDIELAAIAQELQEQSFDNGGLIFAEGDQADSLDLIFQGKVNFTRTFRGKTVKIHSMIKGDYFGETGLQRNQKRDRSANADPGTVLLIITRRAYLRLLKVAPGLRDNIQIMISSRQLAQKLNYPWLNEDEIIFFLARKHQFLLFRALILPVAVLIPVFAVLALAFLFESATFGLVGGFALVSDLAWGVWCFLDWGNDYYIVTNRRVIWLEKVIAFYDSRTEAGMGTILSVATETEYFGRIFDYGTVVVRTFTGQIRMQYVRHPKQASALVEELLGRTRDAAKQANDESMKQAIRTKLGLNKPAPPPPPAPVPAKPVKKANPIETWFKDAFRMRTENGDTITYHKHIFGFLRDASPFALGILILCGVTIAWPFVTESPVPGWFGTIVFALVLILFGRIVYEYVDWQNDIYQVTPEQIIDISRKPFGREDKRVAALENILSTEYERNGPIGVLLNFGTVYIMVGSEAYNFEDVADPPSVQQDIIRRQLGRNQKKKEADTAAEQARMAEWFAMYHRTLKDYNEENQTGESTPPNPG